MSNNLNRLEVPVIAATRESVADYGLFIGTDIPDDGLSIPFYKGSVQEGHNIPFECQGNAVVRSARISKRSGEIIWLERHNHMTQLFVGLGDQPFAMVLGKPNHLTDEQVPNLQDVTCFVFPAGHGIMLYKGTWHDFPLCVKEPVTCLTMNSPEVVAALASMATPDEMNHGDVYKIDIKKRTNTVLSVNFDAV
jgi:ureidoglycolate lyase